MIKGNAWQDMIKETLVDMESRKVLGRKDTNKLMGSLADSIRSSDFDFHHEPVTSMTRISTRAWYMQRNKEFDVEAGGNR